MPDRRSFIGACLSSMAMLAAPRNLRAQSADGAKGVRLSDVQPGDLFAYIQRQRGAFDARLYKQILGAANEFKEGDEIVGVAAADEGSRAAARALLARTPIRQLDAHP